jgi:hypothetical protein
VEGHFEGATRAHPAVRIPAFQGVSPLGLSVLRRSSGERAWAPPEVVALGVGPMPLRDRKRITDAWIRVRVEGARVLDLNGQIVYSSRMIRRLAS